MKSGETCMIEAAAHVRVQGEAAGTGIGLHRAFYRDAPEEMLRIRGADREFMMVTGEWRSRPEHDVAVGRYLPPSSERVDAFMRRGQGRLHHGHCYRPSPGTAGQGKPLISHAMGLSAGMHASPR
jgi:hypothetical protein